MRSIHSKHMYLLDYVYNEELKESPGTTTTWPPHLSGPEVGEGAEFSRAS
jgi:hypothetical protein